MLIGLSAHLIRRLQLVSAEHAQSHGSYVNFDASDALVSLHWLRVPERRLQDSAVLHIEGSAWDRT